MTHRKLSRRRALLFVPGLVVAGTSLVRAAQPQFHAFRNPGCGCCEKWVEIGNASGFDITIEDDPDLAARRKSLGVPDDLEGCHTTMAGDYVLEGHVPFDAVTKLFTEKPAIKGIAVPGMPMYSPGMSPDDKIGGFTVIAFRADGSRYDFAVY